MGKLIRPGSSKEAFRTRRSLQSQAGKKKLRLPDTYRDGGSRGFGTVDDQPQVVFAGLETGRLLVPDACGIGLFPLVCQIESGRDGPPV